MVAHYPVPTQEDIRDLLVDLLGRAAAVDKTDALSIEGDALGLVASYVTDDGEVAAACVCDAAFAVYVGAALVMVPASVAAEQLAGNALDEQYVEYFQEVVNILARLMNTPRTPHLKLDAVVLHGGEMGEPIDTLLAAPEYRRDFVAAVEGYGEGRVSLLVN